MIQTQMRFEEQCLEFDFSVNNSQVCISINEGHKYVTRYHFQAVPQWFKLAFKAIDFPHTPYFNELQALFHLNEKDSLVLPVNYIINYHLKELDVDRDLTFVQITCNTIDEAKRRAYILAALTYDVHQSIFVNLATDDMLIDPFQLQNIFRLR